jgi:acetolactate synthase-1/2/3 large subunit
MEIKVAKYISRFLAENEISDCFMVTGGGAMHLDDAIGHEPGIHCTFNHHEQACSIAAEGYTRMTGRLAAVCVTSGPGGTNAITGVLGAWTDSIPMFVLSGQVKRETTIWSCPELGLRQLGDQEADIIGSVRNITKYAEMVTEPEKIAYHLEKALFLAKHERGGPVWLDIPLDVQGAKVDDERLVHFNPTDEGYQEKAAVKEELIQQIVEKINMAKAPLLLVGTGVRLAGADKLLLDFLNKYRIPVVTAWNANDLVAFDNPYYAGMPGTVGTRPGNFVLQNCDLLISLGCRMNIRMIGYNKFDFAKNAFKIVVDIDEKELKKPTIKPDLPICADVKAVLEGLLKTEAKTDGSHEEWLKWCKDVLNKYPAVRDEFYGGEATKRINPYVFIDKLFDHLDNKDRVICGNGSACVITFQAAKIKQGQRMFTNSGCAAMGYGFPAALGVAVADNDKRTVCIDGDGSIMMNLQEFATVAHNKLNMKVFILNNNGYLSIRQTQTNLFNSQFVGIDAKSGVGFPDFAKLAEAFGVRYFKIETNEDADKNLHTVLDGEEPCICEVFVDESQFFEPKSSSKVLPDGRIVSPSLDDMSPFLDREEFESIRFGRE